MEYLSLLTDLKDLLVLLQGLKRLSNTKKRRRTCCVRETNRDRNTTGYFVSTFLKLKENDLSEFFDHTRMDLGRYNLLLNLLKNKLRKSSQREPILPECRLALTLTYLSQGVPVQYLALSFKLGKETVRKIVLETCEIIWKTLSPIYVSEPSKNDLERTAEDFLNLWNFPNCVGSIDGKHIAIKKPSNSAADYLNYKELHSLVLMAVCDAKYNFTYVDVGAYGEQNDEGAFHASNFGKRLSSNMLPLPDPKQLPGTTVIVPNFFVADVAFPLTQNIMKPYPESELSLEKEIFNKKVSRATKTAENSFGVLVARWRILLTTLHLDPENAKRVVLACIALHNFVMSNDNSKSEYCPPQFVDWTDESGSEQPGEWRHLLDIGSIPSIRPSSPVHRYDVSRATHIRNELCEYLGRH